VEGSAPSETKEETANRVRGGKVGTPGTLGSSARTDRRTMMAINLDQLVPYQEAAWDERPKGESSGSSWRANVVQTKPRGRR
jgi:hypothetical protein